MAEAEPQNPVNLIVAFFSNFLASIKLPFPLPSPQKKVNNGKKLEVADASSSHAEPITTKPTAVAENEIAEVHSKPGVTFPRQSESFASLKLEAEAEDAERSTNPLVLWQVYAIGGFFIMKWAWTRWNERKGRKKPDDDDTSSGS